MDVVGYNVYNGDELGSIDYTVYQLQIKSKTGFNNQSSRGHSSTALAATKTTSSSTVLNWTAPADSTDVVGYNVYNGDELEYATTSTETNYTVTGLTSSTDYTF
jgi:hypothetical protein